MNSAVVSWEVTYTDGGILRERDGDVYAQIDRSKVRSFRLVAPGEIIHEMWATDGRTGRNLVYRRRNIQGEINGYRGWIVWYVMGWIPMGPVAAFQPETEQLIGAPHFVGEAGPLGMIEPLPEEQPLAFHSTDLSLKSSPQYSWTR